jgi:hypothetical protein
MQTFEKYYEAIKLLENSSIDGSLLLDIKNQMLKKNGNTDLFDISQL